jgi:hypothetical protein
MGGLPPTSPEPAGGLGGSTPGHVDFFGATLGDGIMTLQLQHVQPSFISFWPCSFDRSSRRSCPLVFPHYCCFNLSKVKRIQQLTFTLNQSVCQGIIQIFGHVPTFCWWRPHVDVGCFKLVRIKFPKTSANIRGFKYIYIYRHRYIVI